LALFNRSCNAAANREEGDIDVMVDELSVMLGLEKCKGQGNGRRGWKKIRRNETYTPLAVQLVPVTAFGLTVSVAGERL